MNTDERISLVEIANRLRDCPPTVDATTEGAMRFYELCHSLSEAYPMQLAPMSGQMETLQKHLQDSMLSRDFDPDRSLEIPTVGADALEGSDFAEFIKDPCPVIFKGAALETQAVRDWSPQFFRDNYGDFPCVLATEADWNIQGTLGDAADDILSGKDEARYAHNIANIFNDHPDLEAQLELERFTPHLGPGRHIGTHLFIGGSKTGTAFHCANNLNIFFNIYGEKEWFFVHPKHSFWMYGLLQENGSAAETQIDHNRPASEQRDKYPLFEQVPVYSARLGPGDVLINPPWWWHAINNVTQATIGCAARWIPMALAQDANPVFSLVQRLVPHAKEVMKVLRDPNARMTDELYRQQFDRIETER